MGSRGGAQGSRPRTRSCRISYVDPPWPVWLRKSTIRSATQWSGCMACAGSENAASAGRSRCRATVRCGLGVGRGDLEPATSGPQAAPSRADSRSVSDPPLVSEYQATPKPSRCMRPPALPVATSNGACPAAAASTTRVSTGTCVGSVEPRKTSVRCSDSCRSHRASGNRPRHGARAAVTAAAASPGSGNAMKSRHGRRSGSGAAASFRRRRPRSAGARPAGRPAHKGR
jgi:hypothetical protein